MSNKVYGIYPNQDLSRYPYSESVIYSLERETNSSMIMDENHESCRKVLQAFYKKATSKEEKEFYEILLCMKK